MSNASDSAPEDSRARGFNAHWLSLRESADHQSRSPELTQQLVAWALSIEHLNVLELGAGTGSNLRYLSPLLGHDQRWTLVDNDPDLLTELYPALRRWAEEKHYQCSQNADGILLAGETFSAQVSLLQRDLSKDLASLPLPSCQLVTGSALLDLTSAAWLEQLASLCTQHRCAALFVLSYNGHIHWQPELPDDGLMNDLLNAHQMSDKGFGPALGPEAHACFSEHLSRAFTVHTHESDWVLEHDQLALQQELIKGWAPAAIEQSPEHQARVQPWLQQRQAFIASRESELRVGHTDILTLPE